MSSGSQPSPDHLPQSLLGLTVGRYRVVERLGAGGMGEVYGAEDPTLQRRVALKRVAPERREGTEGTERIIKEARRACALSHPGVAAVYDVIQYGYDVILVMEFVEGVTLRHKAVEPLPTDEVLRIVEECAEALGAAHDKGIVHGDVKPENVMIMPSGRIKLLDFGVARRFATPDQPELAETATVVQGWSGTPGYMSPEVLLQNPVDGRADLFSLGVVLYECLTGKHPFRSTTGMRTADRTLHHEPPSISEVNAALPEPLARVAQKLLEKNPDDRYPTAMAVAEDLRALREGRTVQVSVRRRPLPHWAPRAAMGVVLLALVVAGLGFYWAGRANKPSPPSGAAPPYLAVLPLRTGSTSPDDQAFATGLSDVITAQLVRLTDVQPLQVVPADEIRAAHLSDAARAASAIGANLVLTGELDRPSSPSLSYALSTSSGSALHQHNAAELDVHGLIGTVVKSVSRDLGLKLTAAEQSRLDLRPTQDRTAYTDFIIGSGYYASDSPQDIDRAIDALTRATSRDPQFAAAFAKLGMAWNRKFDVTKDSKALETAQTNCSRAITAGPNDAAGYFCQASTERVNGHYKQAIEAYDNALRIDPTLDAAYSGLGRAYDRLHDTDAAERNYRRAVSARPQYWAPHSWLGAYYVTIGRYADAAREFRQAAELAPNRGDVYARLGGAEILRGEYGNAVEALKRGIEIHPTAPQYSNLGTAYLSLRQYDNAIAAFEQATRMTDGDFVLLGNVARAYYWAGKRDEALRLYRDAIRLAELAKKVDPKNSDASIMLADFYAAVDDRASAFRNLDTARSLSPEDPEIWYFSGIVEAHFGDRPRAIQSLEHALALGYSRSEIRSAPELDTLHDQPAFQALIRSQ